MTTNITVCSDHLIGSVNDVEACRGGFDFSLAFQDVILSILPSALFLVSVIPRALYLHRQHSKTRRVTTYTPKLIIACVLVVLEIAILALTASNKHLNTQYSITSATLALLVASAIVHLADSEHVKSIRPSFLITAYLVPTILFDAARVRTEWLLAVNPAYAAVFSVVVAVKVALLALETVEKRAILIQQDKLPSSESTSGPLNRGFFVWLNSLFLRGWRGSLVLQDLPAINEKLDSAVLTDRFGSKWEQASRSGKKPIIFFVTVNAVKWHLLTIVPPRLAMIGLVICRPFLVSQMLDYLNAAESEVKEHSGYGLIGAFALVFTGTAIVQAWYEHLSYRVGAMVRGSLITAIYAKMIKLPASQLVESSAVTLMGNDVETMVEKLNMLLVEWWANTLTVGIAMYLLYAQMGAVCVAPILMAILSLSLSSLVGKAMIGRLKLYQQAQQLRINFTSQVISSIKSVKMLGYTDKFSDLIRGRRVNDIKAGKQFRWFTVLANMVTNINTTQTLTVTFGTYAIVAQLSGSSPFTAAQATVVLSILNVMMEPLSDLLGNVPNALSIFASFDRIQEFLLLDEIADGRHYARDESTRSSESSREKRTAVPEKVPAMENRVNEKGVGIHVNNCDFSWSSSDPMLTGMTTHFAPSSGGSVTMIVGPIGSGKSTLLKSILGETQLVRGTVQLDTPLISFCDQTPWLMNATIRDNIIGESGGYDEQWFKTVVEACDLKTDLRRFDLGALTIVGDKGLKLSGGQKQRMAIARAVYARKSVAIFDDVFSGLDKVTEETVFSRVFAKGGLLRKIGTTVIMVTHAVSRLSESDFIIALDSNGRIVEQGTYDHLARQDGYVSRQKASEIRGEEDAEGIGAEFEVEEEVQEVKEAAQDLAETMTPPTDRSVFKYYFQSVSRLNLLALLFLCAAMETCNVLRLVWLTWWGEGRGGHDSGDLGYWLGLFAMLAIINDFCLLAGIAFFLIVIGPRVGLLLHHRLLQAVMEAPMSFLSGSDAGNLINRFSQDLRLIDIDLNVALGIFTFQLASCFGAASLAVGAISWFAIVIPFVLTTIIMVQRFYIRTSKQLRLLEIEHKAPLYSHFLETINGIVTIRSFGWRRPYANKNIRLLDDAQKPSYLMSCIQIWLKLVLDLVVASLTVLLVVLAVTLKGKFSPSLLGMALVNMMSMNTYLKGIIVAWSNLETALGAVARVKNFAEGTETEVSPETERTPNADWPSTGAMELKNVSVRYAPDADPVLRGISLNVRAGEKVGLCGRSGSGKSSVIQAILRMTEISAGTIIIDGKDISELPRNAVRSGMSCLTQDAFLFTETVRFNMDPTGEHEDDQIINALKRIGLWSVVEGKAAETTKALDETMDETFLSHGQKQLFCLGRALLKESPFLILDEPTSSVDSRTDAQMQEVIRSEFKGRTIIMIAHRLHTLMDFDKIAVLDKGEIVEVGTPDDLLNVGGAFARLYRADDRRQTPSRS